MTNWVLAEALVVMAFPSSGTAQSKSVLVGVWKLVFATDTTKEEYYDRSILPGGDRVVKLRLGSKP